MFFSTTLLYSLPALWVAYHIIIKTVLSPLRRIPGPFIAKLTSKWLGFFDLLGDRTTTIHRLHQQYGPTVRIGPNEVSYLGSEAIAEIYGPQTNFIKGAIYEAFIIDPSGPFQLFALRSKSEASRRQKLLSHAYAQSHLTGAQSLIAAQVEKVVRRVDEQLHQSLDVLLLFRLFAFDVIGELFLGQSFDALNESGTPQVLADLDRHLVLCGVQWNFPWLYSILKTAPLKHLLTARENFGQYGNAALARYIEKYGRRSDRKDLLTKMMQATKEKSLSDEDIAVEIGSAVFAGVDTTSTTLTYLFWELARHPEWQQRLRSELNELSFEDVPDVFTLTDLPVLKAVINEALRMHPAVPASLPRETPVGGHVLEGVFIPQGTIVSTQCYTLQRDTDAFPSPDSFKPERWLEAEADKMAAMKAQFIPFGKGSRACLGQNLALIEMQLITATLLNSYNVSLAVTTTEDTMAMKDHFLAIPASGRCDLRFERV